MRKLSSILVFLLWTCVMWAGMSPRTTKALDALDKSLQSRSRYIAARQARIDSLIIQLDKSNPDTELLLDIVNLYRGFENDSALHYLRLGMNHADGEVEPRFYWKTAALLPLAGIFEDAQRVLDRVDSTALTGDDLISYLEAGRQMHRYAADFYVRNPRLHSSHMHESLLFQQRNLKVMDEDNPWYKYNLAEYYSSTGRHPMARVLFEEILDSTDDLSIRAKTAHHLAELCKTDPDPDDYIYYLALSADADLRSATREVLSLQELGEQISRLGDTRRAYRYLSTALRNAVECGAPVRMIDSATSLPLIEETYMDRMSRIQTATYIALGIFVVMTLLLVGLAIALLRRVSRLRRLQSQLRMESEAREVYISRFLELSSIYMDKLNQFCKIANRKLAAGQADELYRLTKSGKFVEEQSADFYSVFDNMFLHIYPDFVAQVNALLQDDCQIELRDDEQLNTDLRILAFMRLGIRESARIAQMLNYSLNTIYAYRNRLKARAKDKDTFEDAIMQIPSGL